MKKDNLNRIAATFVFITFVGLIKVNSQEESQVKSDEKFNYMVNGYVLFNEYDQNNNQLKYKSIQAGKYLFDIIGKSRYSNTKEEKDFYYYLIKIVPFERGFVQKGDSLRLLYTKKEKEKFPKKWKANSGIYSVIKNKTNIIDIGDQEDVFWIQKDIFDHYLNDGYIKKKYYTWLKSFQFAYGASLSIPFKIRPEIQDKNMKITPEISLGGYVGVKWRIHKYKNSYWYPLVFTAGITTIGINSDNTIKEVDTTDLKDGLVFARTASLGSILEFNSFQIGAVLGWDKPGGEIGKDWIYNDRLWYSFSFGYNFLTKKNDQ